MSRLVLILLTVAVLMTAPVLSTVPMTSSCTADVAVAAAVQDDGEEEMSFWDWLVLWWTNHIGEWPD